MSEARRYAFWMAWTAAAVLAAVAALNAVVDPFGMYRVVDLPGRNTYKPAVANRVRLVKAYDVRRLRPDSVLLSSSRGHAAFRTSHEGWARVAQRRYNLAFDGATTSEMLAYLRHAEAGRHLKLVLLGLDSYHPALAQAGNKPGFEPSQLRAGVPWDPLRMAMADARLLVSADTMKESVRTLESQREHDPEVLSLKPDGQRAGEVRYRGRSIFVEHGPRAYFDASIQESIGYALEWKIPARPRRAAPAAVPATPPDPLSSLDYILKIVHFCREHDIELRMFITPSHACEMEVRKATGAWEWTENGKRALVRALAEDAAAHPGHAPISLYDFDIFSSVTTEPLPPEGSRDEMRFFWDSSHAKQVVGDMVLDQILGLRPAAADLGIRLTPQNIETVIARNRAAAELWRNEHPEEVAHVAQWVAEYKAKHGIVD
jgi:hypothetical protein